MYERNLKMQGNFFSHLVFFPLLHLQIERDTFGKLQCRPYPHDYIDPSRQCSHSAFFMGLQRKQGERVEEGQQFDIRGTVDEFRQSVNMYMFWKPGMEIYVSHVRRKQIPSYVFPDGYKRSRPPRLMSHEQQQHVSKSFDDEVCRSGSGERRLRRKREIESADAKQESPEKRQSISPQTRVSVSPEIGSSIFCGMSKDCLATQGSVEVNGECQEEKPVNVLLAETTIEEVASISNSSVVTNLASEVDSYEDGGPESLTGSCEGNPGSIAGSNNLVGSSQGDSCEADSQSLLDNNGFQNDSEVFKDGLQQELEVLYLYLFCPCFSGSLRIFSFG
ncbi:hypothetical protein LguiA_009968 [Lonicera macranthoides]